MDCSRNPILLGWVSLLPGLWGFWLTLEIADAFGDAARLRGLAEGGLWVPPLTLGYAAVASHVMLSRGWGVAAAAVFLYFTRVLKN